MFMSSINPRIALLLFARLLRSYAWAKQHHTLN